MRFQDDGCRLFGRALEQADALSMLSQLRRMLPDDVVTLVHIATVVGGAASPRQSVGVTFEIAIQLTPGVVSEVSE